MRLSCLGFVFILLGGLELRLPAQVTLLRDTVVDARGTTLSSSGKYGLAINGQAFQGHAVTSFNGYEYVIYYASTAPSKTAAHVAVARRKLPDGAWQVVDLEDAKFQNGADAQDAHNAAALGICPADGTLHISYDHHAHTLRYRRTIPGIATDPEHAKWDASIFQPETSALMTGPPVLRVTYPDFERTPEGNLQFFLRRGVSGAGAWWVYNYDGKTHQWVSGWPYDEGKGVYDYGFDGKTSPSRSAYPNAWTYGPDKKLNVTFVWREDNKLGIGCNHDLCYIYSEDEGATWKNNAGAIVSDKKAGKLIGVNSPGLVVEPHGPWDSMINTQGQAVDSAGQVHTVMYSLDPKKGPSVPNKVWQLDLCSYFHCWRDGAGQWHQNVLPAKVGTRPKLFFDGHDNAYVVFTHGDRTHAARDLEVTDQQLSIAMATKAAQWNDWKVVLTLPGPYVSEVQGDIARMPSDGVLSIFAQTSPTSDMQPTPIHILDFAVPK